MTTQYQHTDRELDDMVHMRTPKERDEDRRFIDALRNFLDLDPIGWRPGVGGRR